MRKKKNIRLFVIWLILVGIVVAMSLFDHSSNTLDFDKYHFALKEKVNTVMKIEIRSEKENVILQKEGRNWKLNDQMIADMSKVNNLLGILSEITARRKIKHQENETSPTLKVKVYDKKELMSEFTVSENEAQTLTIFSDINSYVVNIPGYHFPIADIFQLSSEEWRSKYVFAANWTTLEKMSIQYPKNPVANFEIVYDNQGYTIPTIEKLDTTAMYEYMQQVSSLELLHYTRNHTNLDSNIADLSIKVQDVEGQSISLDFFIDEEKVLGKINNTQYAVFPKEKINQLRVRKDSFIKKL